MIRYFHPNDEDQLVQPPTSIGFDEDSGFWAGVQKCAVAVALATCAAVASLGTAQAQAVQLYEQHEIVPQVVNVAGDEDFWANPVAPVVGKNLALYLPDPEEIPAASLVGQPDEDYWQNPVKPVSAALLWPNQAQFEQHEPAGSLFGQPDEDLWINPVRPATLPPPPIVFRDDDVITQASPPLAADEDFWQNPVAPIAGRFGPLYLPDPEELSAGALFGQPDEDYWSPPRQQYLAPVARVLSDDDVIAIAAIVAQPDEDYWQNQVAPAAGANLWPQPWIFDSQVPGGLHGQPDEDYDPLVLLRKIQLAALRLARPGWSDDSPIFTLASGPFVVADRTAIQPSLAARLGVVPAMSSSAAIIPTLFSRKLRIVPAARELEFAGLYVAEQLSAAKIAIEARS